MIYKVSLAIAVSLGLIACEKSSEPPTQSTVVKEAANKETPKNPERSGPIQKEASIELDLRLPEASSNLEEIEGDFSESHNLPNLFDKSGHHKKDKKISLDGKILQDKTNPDYLNSIEGAELSIKVKTK